MYALIPICFHVVQLGMAELVGFRSLHLKEL